MLSSKRESPKEQVGATADAFSRWLKQHTPTLHTRLAKQGIFPWVVLERHDPFNTMGITPLREGRFEFSGHVAVTSGVRNLQEMIERREAHITSRIEEAHHKLLRDKLDAKPFERMVVQGKIIFLGDGKALANLPVSLQLEGVSDKPQPVPVKTSSNGSFEFWDLPLCPFTLNLNAPAEWKVLPVTAYQPNGIVLAPVYVSTAQTNPEELKTLLEAELVRYKREVNAQQETIQHQLEELETKLKATTQQVDFLYEHAEANEAKLDTLLAEVQSLREERTNLTVLQTLPIDEVLQHSLEPLRRELRLLEKRVTRLEDESQQTKQMAKEANQSAAEAKLVNEAFLALETDKVARQQQEKHLSLELQAKRKKALSWSAAVGGLGALIALQPIPFADNIILTPLQIGLVMSIGRLYGHTVTKQLALKTFSVIGMGFIAQNVTIAAYKFIPGAFFLGGITVPVFTILLGLLAALYFERGETLSPLQQAKLLTKIGAVLRKPEHVLEIKNQGSSLFDKLKAKNFRIKPEEAQADIEDYRGAESNLVKSFLMPLFNTSENGK